jgi:hypothetical protein
VIEVVMTPGGPEVHSAEDTQEWSTHLLAAHNDFVEVTAGEIRVFAVNGTWTYVIAGFKDEGRVCDSVLKEVSASVITAATPLPTRGQNS